MEQERRKGRYRAPGQIREVPIRDIDLSDRSFQFGLVERHGSLRNSLEHEGQHHPIKLLETRGPFRIIDGFRRTGAAQQLGWTSIQAVVYAPMPDDEVRKIAFISNVVRQDLSVVDKANAIQLAHTEGYSKNDVAEMFGISRRQIERYLALPTDILEIIAGRDISMAHARLLADLRDSMPLDALRDLADRIRGGGITARQLREWMKAEGIGRAKGSRRRRLGTITEDRVRFYNVEVTRASSPESRREMIEFLREALQRIEEFGRSDGEAR